MLSKILKLFAFDYVGMEKQQIEAYLAKSTDLADLERRQRELSFRKGGFIN